MIMSVGCVCVCMYESNYGIYNLIYFEINLM